MLSAALKGRSSTSLPASVKFVHKSRFLTAALRRFGMTSLNLAAVLCEDFGVEVAEEGFVQALDYFGDFVFFDDEGEIDFGCTLGDHADFFVGEFAEYEGGDAGGVAQVFSDQADDGFAAFVFYVGEFGEIGGEGGDGLIGVDGERDADFGGGDDVDGDFMTVEGFEDGAQKSVGEEHARGGDIDDGDALFGCDRFENVFALRGAGGDAGAFARGIARIQNIDRNIFLDGRKHGGRVQNFCAEVGEFGCFVEADDFDAAGFGADARVGSENPVDIGPDFDALGAESGAEDGGGKIGAAAADRRGDPGPAGGDESAHNRDLACVEQRLDFFSKLYVGLVELRNGLHVGAVGDEDLARVDMNSVEAAGGKGGGDDFAGEHFAEGGDMIGGAGSDFTDGRNATEKFVEGFEVGSDFGMKFGEECGAQKFAGGVVMTFL